MSQHALDAHVRVIRGQGTEAWHWACVAVVGPGGVLTHALGDPELVTMTRSAIKPFQALPLSLTGATDKLGISDEELALCCASHNGSDRHRAIAGKLLARVGATARDLACGAHWPLGQRLRGEYPSAGEDQDPLRNNCSGKHAGFLTVAAVLGEPFSSYLQPEGAVQRLVRRALADACGVDPAEMRWGIDGCSAPNYAMPLSALARGMYRLASVEAETSGLSTGFARIKQAMLAHPVLVSGRGRFDFELMQAFEGRLIGKGGAEGIQALGLSDPPLGIAIKILDGAGPAVAPVCLAVLEQLGVLDAGTRLKLDPWWRPRLSNLRGLDVGEVITDFVLNPVASGGEGASGLTL